MGASAVPVGTDQSEEASSRPAPLDLEDVALWRRYLAATFDSMLCLSPAGFALAAVTDYWAGLMVLVVTPAYYAGFEASKLRGTVGKIVFELGVADTSGARLRWGRALLRAYARTGYLLVGEALTALTGQRLLSAAVLLAAAGTVLLTSQRQAPHDVIAGTIVRRLSPPPTPPIRDDTYVPEAEMDRIRRRVRAQEETYRAGAGTASLS